MTIFPDEDDLTAKELLLPIVSELSISLPPSIDFTKKIVIEDLHKHLRRLASCIYNAIS